MLGNSGCIVKQLDECKYMVIKHCNDTYPIKRLIAQAKKQRWFYHNGPISCPKVLGTSNNGGYGFIMDYISADNIFDANTADFHWFKYQLIKLIDWELENSEMQLIDGDILNKKMDSIRAAGFDIPFEFSSFSMPIGFCHGDLTLENMLPQFRSNLFLIDFLDSFIDSPWIDVVKLRQDTKHKWILRNGGTEQQHILLNNLDTYFSYYIPYDVYRQLQILNLARIFPYCKNQSDINFLYKEIQCLIQT